MAEMAVLGAGVLVAGLALPAELQVVSGQWGINAWGAIASVGSGPSVPKTGGRSHSGPVIAGASKGWGRTGVNSEAQTTPK